MDDSQLSIAEVPRTTWRTPRTEERRRYAKTPGGRAQKRRQNVRRRQRTRELIAAAKTGRGCQRCGEPDPVVLDFHHPESDKAFSLSDAAWRSRAAVEAEIAKCILLCANCHRRTHHEDRGEEPRLEAI